MAYVERDLILLTVNSGPEKRSQIMEIVSLFRGHVVDVAKESLMVELAGTEEKLEAFVELLKPYVIEELARTGVIAMGRGTRTVKDKAIAAPGGKPRARSAKGAPGPALPPS
jgi:acetolactate synthase-1/3 small subunit